MIILASNSPRRKELLKQLRISFRVENSNVDETLKHIRFTSVAKMAKHLAILKAKAVQKRHPNEIIIAADTIVSLGKHLLGKPSSNQNALRMLTLLNGKMHTVTTGVAVIKGKRMLTEICQTRVWFRRCSSSFLKEYVATGESLDKAGGYGIQGFGSLLVTKISGDYYNVVGLPLVTTWKLLQKIGFAREFPRTSGSTT